ncbi:MAG: hypothetical protein LBI33_03030, partial [Propionibacteriaceae bacterium]|nr:hypothetical protein [Propionibacteriaceae bacterium]
MSFSLYVFGIRELDVDRVAGLAIEVTGFHTVVEGGVVQTSTPGGNLAFEVNPAATVYSEDLPPGVALPGDTLWMVEVYAKTAAG